MTNKEKTQFTMKSSPCTRDGVHCRDGSPCHHHESLVENSFGTSSVFAPQMTCRQKAWQIVCFPEARRQKKVCGMSSCKSFGKLLLRSADPLQQRKACVPAFLLPHFSVNLLPHLQPPQNRLHLFSSSHLHLHAIYITEAATSLVVYQHKPTVTSHQRNPHHQTQPATPKSDPQTSVKSKIDTTE